MYTVIGLITIYIITLIIFQITKNGINYQNAQIQGNIRNVIVLIFTGINGIIIMPQVGNIYYIYYIWDWIYEKYARRNYKYIQF